VPVKGFARGKSRLAEVLGDGLRGVFARSLFEHVVQELATIEHVVGILVITDDDEVESCARERVTAVLRDPPGASLGQVVDAALSEASARGASAALVCMADLPELSAEEVRSVLALLELHEVVVVPDLDDVGTNLLCLSPPAAMPSCFGRGDSFHQHLRSAEQRALRAAVSRAPGICFDVDEPDDLARIA
jgi:2-phospho-L-lactate/phosphoenolpyruvate guanylyltransferase